MENESNAMENVHRQLAENGRNFLESLGEAFIAQRFTENCLEPNTILSSARIERFTRATFPRILLDAQGIRHVPSQRQLQADLNFLTKILEENPKGFRSLFSSLDDPEKFREKAMELNLTVAAAQEAGGGLIELAVIVASALSITGCEPSTGVKYCSSKHPTRSVLCRRQLGHAGLHYNSFFNLRWP